MSNEGMRYLYNSLIVMCFTVLSIAFGKWWLMFLSVFFLSLKNKEKE